MKKARIKAALMLCYLLLGWQTPIVSLNQRGCQIYVYLCRGFAKANYIFLVGGVGVAIHLHPFFDEAKQPLKVHLYVKKYTFSTP